MSNVISNVWRLFPAEPAAQTFVWPESGTGELALYPADLFTHMELLSILENQRGRGRSAPPYHRNYVVCEKETAFPGAVDISLRKGDILDSITKIFTLDVPLNGKMYLINFLNVNCQFKALSHSIHGPRMTVNYEIIVEPKSVLFERPISSVPPPAQLRPAKFD